MISKGLNDKIIGAEYHRGGGPMGIVILIIVIGSAVWLVKKMNEQWALNRAAQEAFRAEHRGWDVYFAPSSKTLIGLNHESRLIVVGTTEAHKQYPWSAIASVDLTRDGTSITSTNRGSQIMGAAVGEVLLGPVGLLIGGVTGSKRTVQRVTQIGLKIIVDDRLTPIYAIDFLRVSGNGADPKNKLVQAAAQRAEHVHALLVNAIRNSSQIAKSAPQISDGSVADRIDQLWKLKEAGALTGAEFEEQKAHVLNGLSVPQTGVR